jgi:hypothetical protein
MKKTVLIALLGLILTAQADKHEHREHEAHVHGGATLNIAFDQLNGKIEFKGAADGIVGFEHAAKSDKDKKTVADSILKFETGIASMVVFDPSLNCVITKELIEIQKEEAAAEKTKADSQQKSKKHKGEHSDFVANFKVACAKSIVGSKVTIDFKLFKQIKDLDVTILADTVQKTAEVKRKPVTVEIK